MAILDSVTIEVRQGSEVLRPGDWRSKAHAYDVTLAYKGRSMDLPYYKGASLTTAPEVTEVLECLVLDADYADAADEYEFADMVGMVPSREVRDMFEQTLANTRQLRAMFDDDYNTLLAEIYELNA